MDVTIKETTYRIGKLNAFGQLHVARRMAPVTGKMVTLVEGYDESHPEASLEDLGHALAGLSDSDVEYIINTCLDAVSVHQPGGGFARLRTKNTLMYEVDMLDMLFLSFHVIKENLGSFFSELRTLLPEEKTPPTSSGEASPEVRAGSCDPPCEECADLKA